MSKKDYKKEFISFLNEANDKSVVRDAYNFWTLDKVGTEKIAQYIMDIANLTGKDKTHSTPEMYIEYAEKHYPNTTKYAKNALTKWNNGIGKALLWSEVVTSLKKGTFDTKYGKKYGINEADIDLIKNDSIIITKDRTSTDWYSPNTEYKVVSIKDGFYDNNPGVITDKGFIPITDIFINEADKGEDFDIKKGVILDAIEDVREKPELKKTKELKDTIQKYFTNDEDKKTTDVDKIKAAIENVPPKVIHLIYANIKNKIK